MTIILHNALLLNSKGHMLVTINTLSPNTSKHFKDYLKKINTRCLERQQTRITFIRRISTFTLSDSQSGLRTWHGLNNRTLFVYFTSLVTIVNHCTHSYMLIVLFTAYYAIPNKYQTNTRNIPVCVLL